MRPEAIAHASPAMDESYWDSMASEYDANILDAMCSDRNGVIRECIESHANRRHRASDFGCGVGKTLPLLAASFAHVEAYDLSENNLHIARQKCTRLSNIAFHHADLSEKPRALTATHFAVSINVLLAPSHDLRTRVLKTIARGIGSGGRLLLVVPSLESALYSDTRLIEWNMREGFDYEEACKHGLNIEAGNGCGVVNGIVSMDGIPTKHYLQEEIQVALRQVGLQSLSTNKVEYAWNTEFKQVPRWLREPYPWDWMVLAEKS